MKLFKSKDEKTAENFVKYLKSMNLDSPNEQCEEIDNKLEKLYQTLDYDEYIMFIKGNKYIKLYDDILGKYANNYPLAKELVKTIPDDMYIEINKILDEKLESIKKEGSPE